MFIVSLQIYNIFYILIENSEAIVVILIQMFIMKTNLKLTAVFEEAEEGGYIAFVEELPGINSQGESLDEAKSNLMEALELVMDTQRMLNEKNLSNKNVIREPLHFAS